MSSRMPALFIGHGSPMNAITENPFAREWQAIGKRLPTPRAILCVSAHWETDNPQISTANPPETIHDFYGFPKALFDVRYPAPGAPWLASRVRALTGDRVSETPEWGLDHGAWQVLMHVFPKADVPVVQLSLTREFTLREHLDLAIALRPLRDEAVLILGSGNIVHNLRLAGQSETPEWATAFDAYVRDAIVRNDIDALAQIEHAGNAARIAVPTREHYLPMLYIVAARFENEAAQFHTEQFDWGSISMRSVSYGL
jgi:4,5-DOPA dioxygenase extradiol